MNNKTIWFDFTNVPHVSFLHPVINHFNNFNQVYSIRDFAETKALFEKTICEQYYLLGKHKGNNKLLKIFGSLSRILLLYNKIPDFDMKISVGGDASNIVAKLKGKISITFDDNEKAPNWRYSRFSDYAFWPSCIPKTTLLKQGFKATKLFQYHGFKEDLYIADFVPDSAIFKKIPFKNYVVVRPENINANYVSGKNSIVPNLLKLLENGNYNILYLPRYYEDKKYASGIRNLYMPDTPLNGLDICFHADAVLTGAGTLAREAACLGIPAVSFYTGKELLTVDQELIKNGSLFFSRNPSDILSYIKTSSKKELDLSRSVGVKKQVMEKLDEIFHDLGFC